MPQILIISPIEIEAGVEKAPLSKFNESSVLRSRELACLYERVAGNNGCLFLDGSKTARPSSDDHLHMDEDNHKKMADGVYDILYKSAFVN